MPINPDNEDKAPTAPELSFDPTTWLRPGQAKEAAAEPVTDRDAPASPAPVQPPAPPSRRQLLIGGGVALAVVGAGGVWLASRPRTPHSESPVSTAGPGGGHFVFTLTDMAAVGQALAAYGLDAHTSGKIMATASAAMPAGADGELRMELTLAPGAPVALRSLVLTRRDGSGVSVTPASDGFKATAVAANTKLQVKVVQGQLDSNSFYSSAVSAGLADVLIPDFFQAFVYDFDFQREIKPGDVFEAAFEQTVNPQGQAIGAKRLIYGSMTTAQKSRALYAFTEPGQKPNWFDGAGKCVQRGLMKTPVEGAQISSGFGMRFHPVLGFTRMHKGTDFATPIGTPVFASGSGKITFMGEHDGHGNYIQIEHTPTLSTAYAHLSAYQPGLSVGSQVEQGQQIALSGNSGLSSGPHLHYEVIVNGQQVDSQTYVSDEGRSLSGAVLAAFFKERDRIDAARVASV